MCSQQRLLIDSRKTQRGNQERGPKEQNLVLINNYLGAGATDSRLLRVSLIW